jgi:OOP family OmpA-OmpF porin
MRRPLRTALISASMTVLACCAVAQTARPAAPASPATAAPPAPAKAAERVKVRSASLPARGLFDGDQLSAAARRQLDALVAEAGDLDIEVAFVAPSGSWQTEGAGAGERNLTPARLQAVRDHLARRGVDARRIYVENRIDPKAAEARLDVELVGRPATQ